MKKRILFLAFSILIVVFAFTQSKKQSDQGTSYPPELSKGKAMKILGYDVAPCTPDRTELELAKMSGEYPTNTALGYKGVVMANFNSTDANDEIMADFGAQGLWYYDDGVWTQVSAVNPELMISATIGSAGDDELIVDFGALGVWMWNLGTPAWTQLTGVSPSSMFASDDDGDGKDEIWFDYGNVGLGVWHYDWDLYAWRMISNLNPYNGLRMDAWVYGWPEACWSFPTYGVWNIYGSWYTQLTGTTTSNDDHASAQFTNTAGAEDLVMDFGSLGIWLCNEDDVSWTQISTMSPNRIREVKFMGVSDYELLIEDNLGGLYWWNWNTSGGTSTLITNTDIGPGAAWCEPFDKTGGDSGDEEVFIPWNAGGAAIFDYSAGSTLTPWINTAFFVKFAVRGDYFGRGRDSTLAIAFTSASPTSGLWLYDGHTDSGNWISFNIPDGAY